MTIAAVATQAGGTATNNSATGARAWTTNVTAGSLIIICAARYSASNDAFVAGDCAKTAGTSTIGAVSLDASANVDTDANVYAVTGIWSAIVTGSGSLTMTVTGASGDYWFVGGDEYTGSWDASRVEDFASATSVTDNTVAAGSGNADSAAAALFVGAMSITNPGNDITITPDGAFTQIAENQSSANMQGSFIRQIVAGATTDAADWTLSGNSLGWSAAVAVYKEAAAGSATANLMRGKRAGLLRGKLG